MKQLLFSRFKNSDYSLMLSQFIAILSKFPDQVLTDLSLKPLLDQLKNRKSDIDLALDKNRKNPNTVFVESCDDKRDDALNAFKYYLLYCSKQPDAGIKEAAATLIPVLKAYGWSLQNENNSEQSKQVKGFIAEVDSKKTLIEALATCSCIPLFELVKSTQADFDTALERFNTSDARIKFIDPLEEKAWLRGTAEDVMLEIIYHKRKGTNDDIKTISREVDSLIDTINAQIRARQSRAKNVAEE